MSKTVITPLIESIHSLCKELEYSKISARDYLGRKSAKHPPKAHTSHDGITCGSLLFTFPTHIGREHHIFASITLKDESIEVLRDGDHLRDPAVGEIAILQVIYQLVIDSGYVYEDSMKVCAVIEEATEMVQSWVDELSEKRETYQAAMMVSEEVTDSE